MLNSYKVLFVLKQKYAARFWQLVTNISAAGAWFNYPTSIPMKTIESQERDCRIWRNGTNGSNVLQIKLTSRQSCNRRVLN